MKLSIFSGTCILILLAVVSFYNPVVAQETSPVDTVIVDSVQVQGGSQGKVGTGKPARSQPQDTIYFVEEDRNFKPRKAALLSAAFPGLGQIYNGKLWKVPIIIGGFGGLTYAAIYNNDNYQLFNRVLVAVRSGVDSENPLANSAVFQNGSISETNLENIVNNLRRDRDFCFILMFGLYGLQIMDAIVDAHLMDFDTDSNLSFELKPSGGSGGVTGGYCVPSYGIAVALKFR